MRLDLSRHVDVDGIDRELNIRRRARADGQAERPASGSSEETPAERDIRAAMATERQRLDSAEQRVLADLDRLVAARPVPAVDAATGAAHLALRMEEGRIGPGVRIARERADRATADLVAFRERNGLDRDAHYPESRVLAIGLLITASVFEAVFSATLFVKDADGGYAEAAAVAMGLGGSNVLLGVLAGYIGLRYWRARTWGLKAVGGAALVAFASLAVGLNLFAARYRESLAADSDQGRPLLHLSQGELFGLVTPEAVVLLMIGVGVWMFAATKGYSGLDEPVPDYGKLDRMARAAQDSFETAREDAADALREPIEAAAGEIDADLTARRERLSRIRTAYDDAGAALAALDAARRKLSDLEQALLAMYRRENQLARTTPAPLSFGQSPAPSVDHGDPLDRAGRALKDEEAAYKDAVAAATTARLALQDMHAACEARLFGKAG